MNPRPIDHLLLRMYAERFASDSACRLLENILSRVAVEDATLNRRAVTAAEHTYSVHVDTWSATSQNSTGRCWIFAALNVFRRAAMERMNVAEFEFSQNYVQFYNKLERVHFVFQTLIETADLPLDDRRIAYLLDHPVDDGGQWQMFANVVGKYGIVPKSAMPETESSSSSGGMNGILTKHLRRGAMVLRDGVRHGAGAGALATMEDTLMTATYRILAAHLGSPPERFTCQWKDKDNGFHREREMTPLEFATEYLHTPPSDYVTLVHDPRPNHPLERTYTVEYLTNMVHGVQLRYLNVDPPTLKKLAIGELEAGRSVWFGSDVGKMMSRTLGVMDAELYQYEELYGIDLTMNKASRLLYHDTAMTHAMALTGVDLVEGSPRRWRVENSWGEEAGKKGFFAMNDNWFDEHVFEMAVPRAGLPEALQEALAMEPIVLPPWDPMGSLA